MFLVVYERFEPLASWHEAILGLIPKGWIARFLPYALVDVVPLVLVVTSIGFLQQTAWLKSLRELTQSAEIYHYLRWVLVAMIVPTAISCIRLSMLARQVCARRPNSDVECTLLSITDRVESLYNYSINHWVVLLLLQYGPKALSYGKGTIAHVTRMVQKVFDDQKQAERFRKNEFDGSRLNVSLNMLRKTNAENENDGSISPIKMKDLDHDSTRSEDTAIETKKSILEFATLLEEPLETVIPDSHVRDTVIEAAKKTTRDYAFLHTLGKGVDNKDSFDTYRRMLNFVLNRISQEFNSRMLCYDQVSLAALSAGTLPGLPFDLLAHPPTRSPHVHVPMQPRNRSLTG